MFDIGFWELLIIGVVGLLVIGPERLPAVATMLGQWVGRLRRFANHMRREIQDELESEHLKQVLEEQNRQMQSLRDEVSAVRSEAASAAEDAKTATEEAKTAAEKRPDPGPRKARDRDAAERGDSGEAPARDGTTDD